MSATHYTSPPAYVHGIQAGMGRAYLIESDAGLVLVDAGSPHCERIILRRMRALGRDDLRLIFVTHAHLDHYGSAAALRRITGAPIAIHSADADAIACGETILGETRGRGRLLAPLFPWLERYLQPEPTPPDLLVNDGDTLASFGLSATVFHTPGHTPGSCSLLVDGCLAFVGDLLSGGGRPHPQRYFADDWGAIRDSLSRLQSLQPAWIYPGHGRRPIHGAMLGGIAAALEN